LDAVSVTAEPPRIRGAGNCESEWTRSRWLQALPGTEADRWLTGVRRLVLVSPHPDDEVLGCGGLIRTARDLGIEVHVISVTDGEACYPHSERWNAERLRHTRRTELVAALEGLGVASDRIALLDVGDGRVAEHEAALAASLHDLLRAGDRVLTTWRGDGHPDHEATARAVEHAVRSRDIGMHQFPVWAWHWMSPDVPQPGFADALRVRLSNDVCAAKRRALACFVSQFDSGEPGVPAILPSKVRQRFERDYEVVLP